MTAAPAPKTSRPRKVLKAPPAPEWLRLGVQFIYKDRLVRLTALEYDDEGGVTGMCLLHVYHVNSGAAARWVRQPRMVKKVLTLALSAEKKVKTR